MKTIVVLVLILILGPFAMAQDNDWMANPTQPSLLLYTEGLVAPTEVERSGIFRQTGQSLGAQFTALLEIPASPKSNVLLRASVGHRQDDVRTASAFLGAARLTNFTYSFGFGVRFLWDK